MKKNKILIDIPFQYMILYILYSNSLYIISNLFSKLFYLPSLAPSQSLSKGLPYIKRLGGNE